MNCKVVLEATIRAHYIKYQHQIERLHQRKTFSSKEGLFQNTFIYVHALMYVSTYAVLICISAARFLLFEEQRVN